MDNEFKRVDLHSTYSSIAKNKALLVSLIIIIIVSLSGAGFLYYQYQKTSSELKKVKSQTASQASVSSDEVKKLVAEVAKVARLPQNETPSIATITDALKLKDQPFFKDAKNGDVLLVYNQSGKAILYDPKEKKVVDVTTLSQTASFNQQFKVAIRNGTPTARLAGKLEEDLKKALGVVNVVVKENAQKETYEKTIVIVLNQAAQEFASNISKTINAQIAEMPSDEPKPKDADVLIIIGKDRANN